MDIIGHQKISFIDYPEKICTVLFLGGCNFRCSYCHNGPIVHADGNSLSQEKIFRFLKKRRKFLDGVCISGGEPTLYEEIYDLIDRIKKEGFLVKLDTNGTNPKLLKRLLHNRMLDYIAMDVKAPFNKYNQIVGAEVDIKVIEESIHMVMNSSVEYEFRTTVGKEILSIEDIRSISELIKGSTRYYLQNFHDRDTVLNGKGQLHPYEKEILVGIIKDIEHNFGTCKLRG